MLSNKEIRDEIQTLTGVKPNLTKSVLEALAQLAQQEIAAGNDFTVPGVCTIKWHYAPAQAKGDRFKKGVPYIGFGGVETVQDHDSPARKAAVKLKAAPVPAIKRSAPKKAGMAKFMTTRVGKAIANRKS